MVWGRGWGSGVPLWSSHSLTFLVLGCRTQQLALQLEPQGLLYIKLTLVDQWDPANSEQEPQVFGVKLNQLVKREGAAIKVPLLIQKCVTQIEKRGLKVNVLNTQSNQFPKFHVVSSTKQSSST